MVLFQSQHDVRQTLRIRRFFLAFAGYTVVVIGTMICYFSGYTQGISITGILFYYLFFVAVLTGVLALFYSGLNLKFKDPSLTLLQLFIAICWASVTAYYTTDEIRGSMTAIYITITLYGIFRLRMREFLFIIFAAVVLYLLAMMLLNHNNPGEVNGILEFVRTMLMLIALLWISYIANYVATLRREIKRLATRDGLTNTYNRREILEIIDRQKCFCDRAGHPFTLCMLDLDHFKKINDTYGHSAGDEVLRTFAQAVKNNIRAEDYLGRYGGEEFLVLFVNSDCEEERSCRVCIDRLLGATRQLSFPDIDKDLRITISIGVTSYLLTGDSVEKVIERADKALYQAKRRGRDRAEYI